jgi:hypothetical protein
MKKSESELYTALRREIHRHDFQRTSMTLRPSPKGKGRRGAWLYSLTVTSVTNYMAFSVHRGRVLVSDGATRCSLNRLE